MAVGTILIKMNRQDEALGELEEELRLSPENAEANAGVGDIYMTRADSAKAIPYLERAVQQDGSLWSVRQQLGKAYYMQKEYAKAITQLQNVARNDTDGSVHFQLGLVYRALGQTAKAGEQFDISRKLKLEAVAHSETELNTLQRQPQ
jgi:tetratricopeptide (TPR) repeat protein